MNHISFFILLIAVMCSRVVVCIKLLKEINVERCFLQQQQHQWQSLVSRIEEGAGEGGGVGRVILPDALLL